ncbi:MULTISPECIES: cation:proton antiporter [Oscillospiraceae]|uniref:K(+)/H(+) antiporter YhaU n=2 Tax=Oscillospiraceae TaxID=216572 RepID=A0A6N2UL34_9FIRM|nr:cation:proton antiporter [Merdimmobilis hominis]
MFHLSSITNASAQVILGLSIILFAGFVITRITKKLRLPNVTGYILSGVLIGPYVLDLIPGEIVEHMEFVTDVALAFIAFGVGRYFKLSTLRTSGSKIVILTLFESLAAAVLVTASMALIFHLPMPFCLLLGAIGSATAPASTIMTIRQYQAKGEFVNTILQVVALDDAVALIAFSVCAAVVSAMEDSSKALDFGVVILPVILNAVTVIAGGALGYVLHRLIDNERRSSDHRLILTTAILLFITGFCTCFDISPLLSCMALGAVYTNVSDNDRVFTQVNSFTPPILLMFFVLSGMRLNLPSLATAGVIGIFYFFIRILGKYTGTYAGARICGYSANIRNYLGLALIPQAGVSIGLAVLGQRLLSPETGLMLSTIILSSGVLYEMVGPACAKASLFLSHSIEKEDAHPVQQEGAAHN